VPCPRTREEPPNGCPQESEPRASARVERCDIPRQASPTRESSTQAYACGSESLNAEPTSCSSKKRAKPRICEKQARSALRASCVISTASRDSAPQPLVCASGCTVAHRVVAQAVQLAGSRLVATPIAAEDLSLRDGCEQGGVRGQLRGQRKLDVFVDHFHFLDSREAHPSQPVEYALD